MDKTQKHFTHQFSGEIMNKNEFKIPFKCLAEILLIFYFKNEIKK